MTRRRKSPLPVTNVLLLFLGATVPTVQLVLSVQLDLEQRFEAGVPPEQDPPLEPVGQRMCDLVFGEDPSGHAENLV